MTKTFLAFSVSVMYFATASPCTASLASARWNTFQPLVDRSTAVADGVMSGRPASFSSGLAARDSPENAGPRMPTTALSSMAFLASAGDWSFEPCES